MTTIIHTPTNQLSQSIDFYKKLAYTLVSENNPTVFTDGKAIIEVNPNRFARAGVKIYRASWTKLVEELEGITEVHKIPEGYLLNDGSGCWIYLIEAASKLDVTFEENSFAIPGNFAGLSLECPDIQKSFAIWHLLGFEVTMGSLEKSYVVLKNEEGFVVSLMKPLTCPHLFFNPSMTFFNGGNNLPIIEKIRGANVPIVEEITHFNKEGIVDNIIIRDPGGYGFFIFND